MLILNLTNIHICILIYYFGRASLLLHALRLLLLRQFFLYC